MAGTGSQTHPFSRWGDYSALSVDPTDDCTFWFTGEYHVAPAPNKQVAWRTRIFSFTLPRCGANIFADGFESGDTAKWSASAP